MTIKISIQDTKIFPRYILIHGKNINIAGEIVLIRLFVENWMQPSSRQCSVSAEYSMSSGAWENKVVLEEVRRYSQDILILRFALSKSQPQPRWLPPPRRPRLQISWIL